MTPKQIDTMRDPKPEMQQRFGDSNGPRLFFIIALVVAVILIVFGD